VVEGKRRLHNEELHNLYAAAYVKVINSGRMRCVGHATRMEG